MGLENEVLRNAILLASVSIFLRAETPSIYEDDYCARSDHFGYCCTGPPLSSRDAARKQNTLSFTLYDTRL